MPEVYIVSDNIISPIGSTTDENFSRLTKDISGVQLHDDKKLSAERFYASLFEKEGPSKKENATYTSFEQLLIASISEALQKSGLDAADKKTVLIISSTKGNIDLLETQTFDPALQKRIAMHVSAKLVAEHFGFSNQPLVVSNACISGLLGILTAKRLIESGQYENAVIAGADIISRFVLSGFQSFQAISPEPCQPFDKDRKGINLGEGAATVILSSNKKYAGAIKVKGGSVSNDANHISAPSRTGKELGFIISKAIADSGLSTNDIDFISAHGTATSYNDEMEAKAITIAGLSSVPTHSLKGYYGHTLGAAGLIESIISIKSLQENIVLPSKGFETIDPGMNIYVNNTILQMPLKNCLKTASGFGGCNAAIVFSK
ncbi:MAG: beta-ketoacyl synthase N-terminal-like domain-containing protein [Bacteroidota bacterium]